MACCCAQKDVGVPKTTGGGKILVHRKRGTTKWKGSQQEGQTDSRTSYHNGRTRLDTRTPLPTPLGQRKVVPQSCGVR